MTNHIELLDQAKKSIFENKFQEALEIYQHILDTQPDEPILYESISNIAFLYYNNNQYEDAIPLLNEAILLPFTTYHGQLNKCLGVIYQFQKKFDLASEYYIEALIYLDTISLESSIVKFELGKILLELNDLDLSYQYLKDVEYYFKDKNKKYYHSIIYYLGFNSFMKEEIELAESYFNVLLLSEDIEDNEIVHAYFGMLHIANFQKNAESIFNFASKILEKDPNFYDKETLVYMTIKAYEYQNREHEFFSALKLFMADFPDGKYKDEYKKLEGKSFKSIK